MSGPIVRSGPTPEYSSNWDNVFGGGTAKKKANTKSAAKATAKKPAKKKTKKKSS